MTSLSYKHSCSKIAQRKGRTRGSLDIALTKAVLSIVFSKGHYFS